MGTRSIVTFKSEWDGEEICAIYRQFDGYPEGRGKELANFLDGYKIGNGIAYGIDDVDGVKFANGMRELAILWAMHEKSENLHGNVYLEPAGFRSDDLEWIYEVTNSQDGTPRVKVYDIYASKAFSSIESALAYRERV